MQVRNGGPLIRALGAQPFFAGKQAEDTAVLTCLYSLYYAMTTWGLHANTHASTLLAIATCTVRMHMCIPHVYGMCMSCACVWHVHAARDRHVHGAAAALRRDGPRTLIAP